VRTGAPDRALYWAKISIPHTPTPSYVIYTTLNVILPSTPTCSRLALSVKLSDHACLTPPYTTVPLGTASSLSVPVRLRPLQYFYHSLYYHPTSTNTYVTCSRYKCSPLHFPFPQLPIWPPTRISCHQHPLIPSSFPTTYPCIPTLQHTPLYTGLYRPPSLRSPPSQIRVFFMREGFAF